MNREHPKAAGECETSENACKTKNEGQTRQRCAFKGETEVASRSVLDKPMNGDTWTQKHYDINTTKGHTK